MRNLKRALSLALAAIMVLGLMVVGASAASTYDNFTDKDEIVNTEAVNTMVSLGVLAGKDDGSYFDPTGIVTRGEMAKIIAVCLNGGKDPVLGDSTNIPKFSDVPATHWAYNYIAYCVQQNIIAGRGDGTFAPDTAVTGSEAAKMFLCALGYRADLEGLVGNEWELNTNVLANQDAKLYDGLETINASAGLSRDNTAQMAYNAVQANEVSYNNLQGDYAGVIQTRSEGTMLSRRFGVVKVEGVVVANDVFGLGFNAASAGKAQFRDTNTYRTENNEVRNYNGVYPVDIPNEYVGQRVVIYVKFPNALAPNAAASKVIGEPILSSKNTVATTGDRMKDADAVKSFLRDNDLSISNNDSAVANDGNRYEGVKTLTKNDSAFADGRITAEAVGVNGTAGRKMTFIDHTGDGTVDYIITENPTLAQVTVYDETNEELTIAGEGSLAFKEIANPEDVAKGDMVLYVKYDDTFYLTKPETVTGAVTAFISGTPSKVTMDGTNYTASANGLTPTGTTLETLQANEDLIGNSYVFYLDAYGNVVAKDLYEEEFGNYALVVDTAAGTAGGTNLANSGEVKLMLNDGTTGVYKVNMLASAARFGYSGTDDQKEAAMANALRNDSLLYSIVTYVVDGSNVTIGDPSQSTNYGNIKGGTTDSARYPVKRATASYNITWVETVDGVDTNRNADVIVNDNTLFYVRSYTGNDADGNPTYRYSLIQGLSKVPQDEINDATIIAAAYQTRTVDNHATNTAKAVVVNDWRDDFKGSREFVYIAGNYTQTQDQIKNDIYEYPAVFEDGEKTTILVKNGTTATDETTNPNTNVTIKSGTIYEYRMNGDYAELFLTNSTWNNQVTSQVSGKSMEVRLGTNGADKYTHTLGTTVINVEDTDKVYVMDNEPTAAMSVAYGLDSDGKVSLIFVRDSDVHFRTVYNTTGRSLEINGEVLDNGESIQVANGFDITVKTAAGGTIGTPNAKDQVVIYAHNDNTKDSGYETGNINALGYGVITMPANSTVLLGSITGNKTFSTTIPDGSGSGSGGSTASGIIKNNVANVDKIDATATISKTGNLSVVTTVDVPEYIPDGATVTLTGDLYIDGAYDHAISGPVTGTVKDSVATIRYTDATYDAEWAITLDNVAVTYDKATVKYVDGDTGADLTSRLADGYTKELSAQTPAAISFTINTSNTTKTLKFSLTGTDQTLNKAGSTANDNAAQQIGVTGGNTTIATTANPKALGTGYVTVTVYGLSDIVETYSITKDANLGTDKSNVIATTTPTGASMDKLGIEGASNDTLKITLSKDTGIGSGDSVSFSAALGAAAQDNHSYDVVVKTSAGDVTLKGVENDTTPVVGWLKNITGNVTITDIVVTAVANFAIDEDNTKVIDSKTLQIAFNMSVADETGAALEIGDFKAGTGVSVVDIKVIDEKTIQVTLNEDLDNNDTVVLDKNKIVSKDDKANAFSADQTIKIALSDGTYSIADIT